MASGTWVIAYDLDTVATEAAHTAGGVTTMTVYNRIRAALATEGFNKFMQLSIYAMPDDEGALVRVYRAINAVKALPDAQNIKRLHVFRIDGALNDVLPLVTGQASAPAP